MKWTLNINQQQAVALGLKNVTEAIILGMICDCHSWAEPQIVGDSVFYWTARQEFVRQLPLLDLKDDTVYRYLRNLEKLGLIEYRKLGKKDCVRLTNIGKTYYVGKKSESEKISEKNPSKSGKKSEKNSEKNPIDSSIKTYSSINDSSSSSLPPLLGEEEEDGIVSSEIVPLDPYFEIPEEGMDSLSRDTIIIGVERLVSANAGDEGSYRKTLIREIMSGGGRTIRNIRNHLAPVSRPDRPRIGSNRGEPSLPPGVSIFDLIEQWSGDEGGAV